MNDCADRAIAPGELQPSALIGLAALAKVAFRGADLGPIARSLIERSRRNGADAAALMDLSLIELFQGREQSRAELQARALKLQRYYRHARVGAGPNPLKVLALAAPGDLMANTPIEFLLESDDVVLDVLYVLPEFPPPEIVPDHDVAFVVAAEGEQNRSTLALLAERLKTCGRDRF